MSFPIMPILKLKSVGGGPPPLDDIWLWLNFDNNFLDSSGNGFDFTQGASGAGCPTDFGITADRDSNLDSALRVANICGTANISMLHRSITGGTFTNGLTFSAWIKKINNQPNVDCVFTTKSTTTNNLGIFPYNFFGGAGTKSTIQAGGTIHPYADLDFDYHHHFITIDSGKVLNFWLDKVKILDGVSNANHVDYKEMRIGDRIANPFNGVIDHIIIYEAAHPEFLDTLFNFG